MLRTTLMLLGSLATSTLALAQDYRIETVTAGLEHPWSLAFLPDGRMLVTERVGRLRIIDKDGSLDPEPVVGVPEAFVAAQAGLMEVLLDPDFARNQWLYLSYAYGTEEANNTRLARGRLVDGQLLDVEVLFSALPAKAGAAHYGGRMVFLPDQTLVLALGDGPTTSPRCCAPPASRPGW
jgi:glucose/arabinose dehydrogenase